MIRWNFLICRREMYASDGDGWKSLDDFGEGDFDAMNTESGKIYVTTYKNYILTAVYEEGCLAEIYADKQGDAGILHRIYVGKVKHIG